MFVTFADSANPSTVREVTPESLGVERITIEITDEDVTEGIEERLIWLPDYYGRQLSGDRFQTLENSRKGISAYITSGLFSSGNGLSRFEEGE